MDVDTDIGGPRNRFPVTSHSAIVAAASSDAEVRQRALETIVASYWKPAYKYIRIKWQASNEDAKDLTQSFFTTAIEKSYFASYEADKASFQTFLRTCLDHFIANQKKSEQRLKRGAGADHLSLDFAGAESELAGNLPAPDLNTEDFFHREWVRSLFTISVETLEERYKQTGRDIQFKIFELYDLQESVESKISYGSLATEFEIKVTDVTNYLAGARRDFRRILLEKVRELTGTEAEYQTEVKALLGIDVK